jgi:3-oxoadipate enol-lactonase
LPSFITTDGLQLAYYVDDFTDPWKQAPVLLLLHAAMGSAKRYYAWVPALARHYRVVRLDLRGHGRSVIPSADRALTLERLVGDVAELMDHIGCPGAHIAGNSAGGYLGQQMAMNHGDRVRSLMLFGSTPGLKNSQAPSWIPQIEAKGLRGFLAETIAERLPPPWRIEDAPVDGRELRSRREGQVDPGLVEWFLDEAAKNDPAYIAKFVLLMASYDWSDQLGRIQCPTLVVVPGAEPIGSTANYEPFRRLVPDVQMRVYDDAPHNICDAFPDRCAGDVLEFLTRRFGLGV